MKIKKLDNNEDYNVALKEVGRFFDNEPEEGTPEADRFEILVMLIEAYEAKHYPI